MNEIKFIREQIGDSENFFKKKIIELFHEQEKKFRAYLVQVEFKDVKDFNIVLCIAWDYGKDERFVNDIAEFFHNIFNLDEHLDIIFLTSVQEVELRKVCCPFFSSMSYSCPDFYLSSSEGYNLENERACYKEKRLIGEHPDGYMLCKIDPPILGQQYGLGEKKIDKIIIASRHVNFSIFTIDDWPAYIHVARLIHNISDDEFVIKRSDIESIGWAEIYRLPEGTNNEAQNT